MVKYVVKFVITNLVGGVRGAKNILKQLTSKYIFPVTLHLAKTHYEEESILIQEQTDAKNVIAKSNAGTHS